MSWEDDAELYLGMPKSESAPLLLPKVREERANGLQPLPDLTSRRVLFDDAHGLVVPGWSLEKTSAVGQRLAAEKKWRSLAFKLMSFLAVRDFTDEGGWASEKFQAGHGRLLKEKRELEDQAAHESAPRIDMSNRFGSLPTGIRDEFDASSMWRLANQQINRSRAMIRPLSPLESKTQRTFATQAGPPLPVARSSVKFDKKHHGQARRAKLALKQLDLDPTHTGKEDEFRRATKDLARSRYFIDADVEWGGATVYPDPVWGVSPERVHTPAGKPGRNEPREDVSSGIEFSVSYNRHRGYNIKSQAMKMPCPRRIKKRINIHKLLPDSHYALGAFHVNESDPDCYYRDQQEMVRVRYYKLGTGAYQEYLREHPPTPPPEEEEDEERDDKPVIPKDDWAPGGAFHHLIFGGPSDDDVMKMLTGEAPEETDDEPDWLDEGVSFLKDGEVGGLRGRKQKMEKKISAISLFRTAAGDGGSVVVVVPAALQATFGSTIKLPLRGSVGGLKALAASVLGLQPSDLLLAHGGSPLEDDGITLISAGVSDGGVINAMLSGPTPPKPFIVTIPMPPSLQLSHGQTLTLATSSSATIASLQVTIESLTGLSVANQELSFHGSKLTCGSQTLGSAGIPCGAIVHLGDSPCPAAPAVAERSVILSVPTALQATFGSEVRVIINDSTTVSELQALAATLFGVKPEDLTLAFGKQTLSNGAATLLDVPNGGVVNTSLSKLTSIKPFAVTVPLPPSLQALHGQTLTLATSRDATVGSLMALIESLTGLPVRDQELSFGGVVLSEDQTNGKAGIINGSTIYLRHKANNGDQVKKRLQGDGEVNSASGNGNGCSDGSNGSGNGRANGRGNGSESGSSRNDGSLGGKRSGPIEGSSAFKNAFGSGGNIWSSVDNGMEGDPEFDWLNYSFWRARKHGPRPCESRDFVDTKETLRSGFWSVWKGTSGYTCLSSDDGETFGRAFSYAKIEKDTLQEVAKTLNKWYPMLLRIYVYYSCIGADVTNCVEGISSAGYALLISDAKLDIEAGGSKARCARTRGEDGWDLLWVAVNSSKESIRQAKEEGYNAANRMCRCEFLEFIVRASSFSASTPPNELPRFVEMFCEDLLLFLSEATDGPNILHRADQFRREFCYTRETTAMLAHHEETLRNVYAVYAERGTGGAEMDVGASVELLSAAEWFALMRDLGIVKECGVRNIYLIFALSRMAVVHESNNTSGQLTQLTFEGFCEAIVRLSLVKALPTDKEMKKRNFQYPGEYIGAILSRGVSMYDSWVAASKRGFELGKADPVYRRVDMLLLLIVSIMQFGVEQQPDGPTILLRGHPDEILSLEEVNKYFKFPTRTVFEEQP